MIDEEELEKDLNTFRHWMGEHLPDGLGIPQLGAHLVLQLRHSPTGLGRYLTRMLAEPSSVGGGGDRQRGVLPLPVLPDSRDAVRRIVEGGEYKRLAGGTKAKKDLGGAKVHREMRKNGLLTWHFRVTLALNFLWSGCRGRGRICDRGPTKAQKLCQDRLWEAVKRFVDDTSETNEKYVKAPDSSSWKERLEGVKLSYQGEIVEKAQELTLRQILPGLPPPGYGGRVKLEDLCEGETKEMVMDPLKALLQGEDLPEVLPKPRVMATKTEWELIAGELFRRGLVRTVERPASLDGKAIINGAFGVPKPGKVTEENEQVLRLIMDFRCCNAVCRVIEGDVRTLAGAPALQHLILPEGVVLRISAEDLVSAFYLFALPEDWSRMMCFERKVSWKALGRDQDGETYIGAAVLPMGWNSAVGILQHAHRNLALRPVEKGGAGLFGKMEIRKDAIFPRLGEDGSAGWSLYLDDTSILELLEKRVADELKGKTSAEQERMRAAYSHWGIPYSPEKALVRSEKAEKLGAVIDGDRGLLRAASRRAVESLALSAWLLRLEYPTRKSLQVYAGKEVHTLQFRRPLFSVFDWIWKAIGEGELTCRLSEEVIEEMLMAGCLQPMKFTDLRSVLNEVVTASDACESGGGSCYASRLSMRGLSEVVALEEKLDDVSGLPPHLDGPEVILVFDFFAGIGGLSRSLALADIKVASLVVVESDPDCRRLHRRRWPGCRIYSDIQKLEKKEIEKLMRTTPGITGVIAGGGSPCQGLSVLSTLRRHLEDPRSALFFDLAEKLRWIQDIAVQMQIWSIRFCENVVGDPEDVSRMSAELEMNPVMACSSDISRVRRPRLFWSSSGVDDHGSFSREFHGEIERLKLEGPVEPLDLVVDVGWIWPQGELDDTAKLPTFTRAIPRKKPPPSPAGLGQCDELTQERWRRDRMQFPPYTYKAQHLFRGREGGTVRVASANERELLMGFPKGYTQALFKKKAATEEDAAEQEVRRKAAIGNAFHCVVVGSLLDLWLWSRKIRTEPRGTRWIIKRWHEEMRTRAEDFENEGDEESMIPAGDESEGERLSLVSEHQLRVARSYRPSEAEMDSEKMKEMSQALIHHYLRRMEFRGSDVRLDVGLFYRPDAAPRTSIDPSRWSWTVAHSYPFKTAEHINILELRAILHTLEWRARTSTFHSCRFLHLSDSQVCLAVLTKGRSSSRKVNRLLRRVSALCLALNVYPLWAWIESRLNPADEPSRRFEDAQGSPAL